MKIHQLEPCCSMQTDGWMDGWTDRQTDITKLIVAFRSSANAPNYRFSITAIISDNIITLELDTRLSFHIITWFFNIAW